MIRNAPPQYFHSKRAFISILAVSMLKNTLTAKNSFNFSGIYVFKPTYSQFAHHISNQKVAIKQKYW